MKTIEVEFMLLAWSDVTSKAGPKILFGLVDSEALEPFKSMTLAKGNIVGQRLVGHLVELNDDETPKDPKPKGGPLSVLAALWCKDPAFQEWVRYVFRHVGVGTQGSGEAMARAIILSVCEIHSRAELDHNATAAHTFDEYIRKPYRQHLDGP